MSKLDDRPAKFHALDRVILILKDVHSKHETAHGPFNLGAPYEKGLYGTVFALADGEFSALTGAEVDNRSIALERRIVRLIP